MARNRGEGRPRAAVEGTLGAGALPATTLGRARRRRVGRWTRCRPPARGPEPGDFGSRGVYFTRFRAPPFSPLGGRARTECSPPPLVFARRGVAFFFFFLFPKLPIWKRSQSCWVKSSAPGGVRGADPSRPPASSLPIHSRAGPPVRAALSRSERASERPAACENWGCNGKTGPGARGNQSHSTIITAGEESL